MAENPMLKFVDVPRIMPEKRDANVRREDFDEIYAEYADAKAKEQASRCSQCGRCDARSEATSHPGDADADRRHHVHRLRPHHPFHFNA